MPPRCVDDVTNHDSRSSISKIQKPPFPIEELKFVSETHGFSDVDGLFGDSWAYYYWRLRPKNVSLSLLPRQPTKTNAFDVSKMRLFFSMHGR